MRANNRFHCMANPRHANCVRTWRATGQPPVKRVVRQQNIN
jgi:hypothetical protein